MPTTTDDLWTRLEAATTPEEWGAAGRELCERLVCETCGGLNVNPDNVHGFKTHRRGIGPCPDCDDGRPRWLPGLRWLVAERKRPRKLEAANDSERTIWVWYWRSVLPEEQQHCILVLESASTRTVWDTFPAAMEAAAEAVVEAGLCEDERSEA